MEAGLRVGRQSKSKKKEIAMFLFDQFFLFLEYYHLLFFRHCWTIAIKKKSHRAECGRGGKAAVVTWVFSGR